MVSPCFQFERGQHFPFDWPASVSNMLTVRNWAEPKVVGRNFTSRIRPLLIRFKDGNLVEIDDVSSGNNGSIYVLSGLTKADEGQYTCRAVSLGGKKFSRTAKVVVKGTFV